MGGPTQTEAEAAVEAAKKYVELNGHRAEAHVRLASAYIALGNHSNDACNCLQRALQLDPRNPLARDMLVRELRRDHRQNGNRHHDSNSRPLDSATTTTTGSAPRPSAPPQDREYSSSSAGRNDTSNSHPQPQQERPPPYQDNDNINDEVSWQDRIQFYVYRAKLWYASQSEDVKTVLKVFLGLIVLYVAFGGRFGLEYVFGSQDRHARNYNSNAYEEFYQSRQRQQQQQQSYNYHDSRSRHHGHQSNDYYDPYSGQYRRSSSSNGYSWGGSSGNYSSMLMLAAVAYIAHRNGMNPLQALFFVNMAMGRGRGRRPFMNRNRGWGPGMMGGGGGFRHRGRPGAGMWRW